MKKVLIAILAVVGVLALMAVMFVVAVGVLASIGTERVPSRVLLEIDFEAGVIESVPDDPLAQLMLQDTTELRDVVDALERAGTDRRVRGLVARIGGRGMGLAHLQEIRDAVRRFRESGKPAWAFAETFGEFGPGNGGYYLATAFDRIYLQPSGDVGLTGLMYESMFVRGLLDKLEIDPDMGQRMEFKNIMNYYTDTEYNEPYRLAMQELMDSQFGQLVRGIAAARGLDEERVLELFDAGPFLADEALEAGLVDELAYRDEVYDALRERVEAEQADTIDVPTYLRAAGRPHRRGETIALIHGHGAVVRGPSGFSPLDGSVRMGADTVASAFRSAIDDRRVRAIVFRVDSPGGSYVASDTIWRETIRARDAGKPVIVSMGNLAGSGGYFVAMHAEKIVAQPGSITASIGVAGGKLVTRGLWEKLGITWDDVRTSEHAHMWSTSYGFGAARERFEAGLDRIYEDFTRRVAEGRDLPLERVREMAKGRIWTGEHAKALGLVDELGGLDLALRLAREAIGVEPDAPIRIRRFPRKRSPWELLVSRTTSSETVALRALAGVLAEVQPKVRLLKKYATTGESGRLAMTEIPHGGRVLP